MHGRGNEPTVPQQGDAQSSEAGLGGDVGDEAIQAVNEPVQTLRYPVTEYLKKISSFDLDKTPEVQERLAQLRQDLLIAALEGDYLKKHPITDSDLKAEYDRQINLIGDSQEYNLKQIIVANEADAKAILSALKRGESFEKLAKEKSLDPSKEQGGNLGWVLAKQIIPEIANVLANMSRGSLTAAPIQTSLGWHVIKLEDSRQFKAPTFEESKVRVHQTLMQARRIELLGKLREAAKIVK